jgi:hypothetical protein
MSKEELKVVANDPIDLDDDKPAVDSAKDDIKTDAKSDAGVKSTDDKPEGKSTVDETKDAEDSGKTKEKPEEEEEAPPAPPRPVSPVTSMKNNLKEAFPTIDDRVITGVLIASQGNLDTSFNALLYISDETIERPEIILPVAEPPRPARPAAAVSSQGAHASEDDEALARKLQIEFELEEKRRRRQRKEEQRRRLQVDDDDSPDEFEQFKENFSKGVNEARTTLNSWDSGLAKKLDGQGSDDESSQRLKQQPPKLFGALGGSSAANSRRFDDDPEISHDFNSKVVLNDNDKGPELPKRKTNDWQSSENVPVNSDAFMVTDSEDEDKKDIKL